MFETDTNAQLSAVKGLLTQLNLRFVELPPLMMGSGVGVAWAENDFLVVSIPAGSPHSVSITCGVLRDIAQNRVAALEACNRRTSSNAAYPFYLHDADAGWDILVQQSFPLQLLQDAPPFFDACLEPTTRIVAQARVELEQEGVSGTPYTWNAANLERLLMRSLV